MDNSLLGGDTEDFPLNGGKSKLAKLFQSEPVSEVSLKYTAPKEPRMKPVLQKNPSKIHLKVIIGKTVEAFKMETIKNSAKYLSFGRVGVAILGSEEKEHYQIYIYRNDEQKVSSADIDFRFQFEVSRNNYATFIIRNAERWSLQFDKSSDLADFCREVALARWRSSGSLAKLVQNTVYGDEENRVGPKDTVVVFYKAYYITQEKQLGKESKKGTTSFLASSQLWDTDFRGFHAGSSRIIILPQQQGRDLFIDVEIKEIRSPTMSSERDHTILPQQSIQKDHLKGVDGQTAKTELLSRISKMGQPLLPFPNFPSKDPDSEPESNGTGEFRSLEDLGIKPIGETETFITQKQTANCGISPNAQEVPVHDQPTGYVKQRKHFAGEEPVAHNYSQDFSVNAQFNVLFSELRTCNAELRMSLTRLTDRIESISYKVDNSNESMCSKLCQISKQIDSLMERREECNSSLNMQLAEISEKTQCLASDIMEKKYITSSGSSVDLQEKVLKLEKQNKDLEELVLNSEATAKEFEEKIQGLQKHLSVVEKQKEVLQKEEESKKSMKCTNCKENNPENMKKLENSLGLLKERCRELETHKIELEKKNLLLEEELKRLSKKKETEDQDLLKDKLENSKRVKELESELLKTKKAVGMLEEKLSGNTNISSGSPTKNQVTAIVMKIMNMTYKILKKQLSNSSGIDQEALADTLRKVTSSFLTQVNDSESSNFENSSKKVPGSAAPEPVPRPRTFVPAISKQNTGRDNNSNSPVSFSTDSPLPNAPKSEINSDSSGLDDVCGKELKQGTIESSENLSTKLPMLKNVGLADDTKKSNDTNVESKDSSVGCDDQNEKCLSLLSTGNMLELNSSKTENVPLKNEPLQENETFPVVPAQRLDKVDSVITSKTLDQVHQSELEDNKDNCDSSSYSEITEENEMKRRNSEMDGLKQTPDNSNPVASNETSEEANSETKDTESNKKLPFTFVPMIKPEPPPILNSRSPSPSSINPIQGDISDHSEEESTKETKRKGNHNGDVWRSQPPPLFDDEENDEWLFG